MRKITTDEALAFVAALRDAERRGLNLRAEAYRKQEQGE